MPGTASLRRGAGLLAVLACLLGANTTRAARISEPGTTLYGRVVERVGDREFPITGGQLVWKLRTVGPGGREYQLTTRLERLAGGRYSYRLTVPQEVLAYDLAVSAKAVALSSGGARIEHVAITLDGQPLAIAPGAVDGLSVEQWRRAGIQRIDLARAGTSPDSDRDGLPDWWEDRNGLDKWDATDAAGPSSAALVAGAGAGAGSGAAGSAAAGLRTFAEWRAAWFPGQSGDLDAFGQLDGDGDGVANFLEYAFDLNPTQADAAVGHALPHPVAGAGRAGVAFRKRAGASDLEYRIETSADLFQWSDATDRVEVTADAAGTTSATLAAVGSDGAAAPQQFFRVRVNRR